MKSLLVYITIFLTNGYGYEKSFVGRNLIFYGWEPRSDSLEFSISGHYQTVDGNSPVSCVAHCSRRPDCGHAVFCMKTEICYLDYSRKNYCASDFHECSCFAKWRNVALHAQCEVSSERSVNLSCIKALDGEVGNGWRSYHEGVGAWIKIYLNKPRVLLGARMRQLIKTTQRNKDVRLEFSDGSRQEFSLSLPTENGQLWDDLDLTEVNTSWVNITVLSVYGSNNNGFREIELYSTP